MAPKFQVRFSLACICIVLEHLAHAHTWSQWSASIQQLFELLCARPCSGHQGCSSEQNQPGAGAAPDFTRQDPALTQLCSCPGDRLKAQWNVRKIQLGKMKANNFPGKRWRAPVRTRGGQWDRKTKRRAWASVGGSSRKSCEIIEEGLFTNEDAGAPEIKWFTQETESEFKHRISCLFRIQTLV